MNTIYEQARQAAQELCETAGLQKGDIILQLEKEKIKSVAKFRYELYKHSIGDEIKITYLRDGKERSGKATLKESQ